MSSSVDRRPAIAEATTSSLIRILRCRAELGRTLLSKHRKRAGRVRNKERIGSHVLLTRSWLHLLTPSLTVKRRQSLSEFDRTGGFLDHRISLSKDLFLHALISRKILNDASLLKIAKDNFRRWPKDWERSAWSWWIKEWRKVLNLSRQDICDVICEQSEYGLRLRVLSPLEDLLTQKERSRIEGAMSILPIRAMAKKHRLGSENKQRATMRDTEVRARRSPVRRAIKSKE